MEKQIIRFAPTKNRREFKEQLRTFEKEAEKGSVIDLTSLLVSAEGLREVEV